jgi:hypothetical protein
MRFTAFVAMYLQKQSLEAEVSYFSRDDGCLECGLLTCTWVEIEHSQLHRWPGTACRHLMQTLWARSTASSRLIVWCGSFVKSVASIK